ncbi:MAG: 3-keto-disaccharide hydrolase [Terracidiphilus sp.]
MGSLCGLYASIVNHSVRRNALRGALLCAAILSVAAFASSQTINMFPAKANAAQTRLWTRVAIPPTRPLSNVDQWHIDAAKREILCDGNQGHEWLRFNHELGNFDFRVSWRFTPVAGTTKYNSGVFFRNSKDGTIWLQAQTSLAGGYIFGMMPPNSEMSGKLQRFNLQKDMTENRVKPAGQWNAFDIRCVGETCTLAVNGAVVNTLHTSVTKGYVGLEAEGYRIEFKDFHLRQLK